MPSSSHPPYRLRALGIQLLWGLLALSIGWPTNLSALAMPDSPTQVMETLTPLAGSGVSGNRGTAVGGALLSVTNRNSLTAFVGGSAWLAFTRGTRLTPLLPAVQFSSSVYSVTETAGAAVISVELSAASSLTATVDYATHAGTALAGSDYLTATGSLTFAPGVIHQSFSVPIIADALGEDAETVDLTLSNPGQAVLGLPFTATLTIVDFVCSGLLEPNDNPAQANAFPVGATQSHSVCAPGDQDWVSFTVTTTQTYRLETLNLAAAVDTVLELYDGSQSRLAYDDDGGDEVFASAIEQQLTPGTYYVKVYYFDNFAGGPAYTYDLRLWVK